MRNFIVITITSVFCILASCNSNNKEKKIQDVKNKILKGEGEKKYLYTKDNDTVLLVLRMEDYKINGEFAILPFEKDMRKGIILNGQIKGDTLFADYQSMQEGINSNCEIAFLKKGSTYVLSNDFLLDRNYYYNSDYTIGKFKNKQAIIFDGYILNRDLK